jgi:hypothetical protein
VTNLLEPADVEELREALVARRKAHALAAASAAAEPCRGSAEDRRARIERCRRLEAIFDEPAGPHHVTFRNPPRREEEEHSR